MLSINNLHVTVDGKEILKGITLQLNPKEKVALMGPNGSGKTTLCNALMGNPKYQITKGTVTLNDEDITKLSPEQRAKRGMFLSFQNPEEISGVTLSQFLRLAYNNIHEKLSVIQFNKLLKTKMHELQVNEEFADRYLNEGFSGGEKKKSEILQMLTLQPKYAILDETDSGLDVDALNIISEGINKSEAGMLIITHYTRILERVKPDRVVILRDGIIQKEGGPELANELEKEGFRMINK